MNHVYKILDRSCCTRSYFKIGAVFPNTIFCVMQYSVKGKYDIIHMDEITNLISWSKIHDSLMPKKSFRYICNEFTICVTWAIHMLQTYIYKFHFISLSKGLSKIMKNLL